MNSPITPNFEESQRFLRAIDSSAVTFCFQTFAEGEKSGDQGLTRVLNGSLDEHFTELSRLNMSGAGVFVTINQTDGNGRKERNICRVRAVFEDQDTANLPRPNYLIEPHIEVESSPGKSHRYWLVHNVPLELFRKLQTVVAESYDSDKNVKDLPRVMRLPGFYHMKKDPYLVRIQAMRNHDRFALHEINEAFSKPNHSVKVEPIKKIEAGSRHNALLRLAARDKAEGLSETMIRQRTHTTNNNLDSPLSEKEVQGIVEWASSCEANDIETAKREGMIILPCDRVPFSEAAAQIFPMFAKRRDIFVRGAVVVELRNSDNGPVLDLVTADAFRSRVEKLGKTYSYVMYQQRPALREKRLALDSAKALLATREARELLPPIRAVVSSPVLTIVGGSAKVLDYGYNPEAGGVFVTRNVRLVEVELDGAIQALTELLIDFDFISPSDKSRAIAAIITPCIRIGKMISGAIPVDVIEADKSQAGKGFFQKLVHAIYGESPYPIAKREGGVGSLDESISSALISGRLFVTLDNVRGKLDSQFLEMVLTWEGEVAVRVPHRGEVGVDASGVVFQMTSNGVEVTPDLANRSSIVRIRKQSLDYQYAQYPEGDLLAHVGANQGYFLSCVHTVVRHWFARGMPHSTNVSHDLRDWAGKLDWILTNIFKLAPLMEGHDRAKERASDKHLVWLREVALSVAQVGDVDVELSATAIMERCEEDGINIPGLREGTPTGQAIKMIGKIMGRLYRRANSDQIELDDVSVIRIVQNEYDHLNHTNKDRKYYKFVPLRPVRSDNINGRKNRIFSESSTVSPHSPHEF